MKKNSYNLEVAIDPADGIGDKAFQGANASAFVTSSNKTYFNLIHSDASFASGDVVSYRGNYRIYHAV